MYIKFNLNEYFNILLVIFYGIKKKKIWKLL